MKDNKISIQPQYNKITQQMGSTQPLNHNHTPLWVLWKYSKEKVRTTLELHTRTHKLSVCITNWSGLYKKLSLTHFHSLPQSSFASHRWINFSVLCLVVGCGMPYHCPSVVPWSRRGGGMSGRGDTRRYLWMTEVVWHSAFYYCFSSAQMKRGIMCDMQKMPTREDAPWYFLYLPFLYCFYNIL